MHNSAGALHVLRLFPRARRRSYHPFLIPANSLIQQSPRTNGLRFGSSAAALAEEDEESRNEVGAEGRRHQQPEAVVGLQQAMKQEEPVVKQEMKQDDTKAELDTSSFLETDTTEYERIIVPPSKFSSGPISVPWPTLFAPRKARAQDTSYIAPSSDFPTENRAHFLQARAHNPQSRTKPCAKFLQLVRTGHFVQADRLRQELDELGIEIHPNIAYLKMVRWAMDSVKTPPDFRSWRGEGTEGEKGLSSGLGLRLMDEEIGQMELLRLRELGAAKKLAIKYLRLLPTYKLLPRLPKYRIPPLIHLCNTFLQNNHHLDVHFTRQVLFIAASKGMLEGFVRGGLFREWVTKSCAMDVRDSLEGVNEMIDLAAKGCELEPPEQPDFLEEPEELSSEAQAALQKRRYDMVKSLRYQATILRNLHLQAVINMREPQVETVKEIFKSGAEHGVVWGMATKRGVLKLIREGEHQDAKEKVTSRSREEEDVSAQAYLAKAVAGKEADPDPDLAKRVLQTAHRRTNQKASEIVTVISRLTAAGRTDLVGRLANRFSVMTQADIAQLRKNGRRGLKHPGTNKNTFLRSFWLLVKMMRYKEEMRYAKAIGAFQRNYLWAGLPDLAGVQMVDPIIPYGSADDMQRPRMSPTTQIISVVVSCILRNLEDPTPTIIRSLHESAILSSAMHDPPIDMDDFSHLPYIMALTHVEKPLAVEEYLRTLESRGVRVGVACWTAVATEYARTTHGIRAVRALDRYSRGKRGKHARGLKRMYLSVTAMHLRRGQQSRAKHILARLHSVLRRRDHMPSVPAFTQARIAQRSTLKSGRRIRRA